MNGNKAETKNVKGRICFILSYGLSYFSYFLEAGIKFVLIFKEQFSLYDPQTSFSKYSSVLQKQTMLRKRKMYDFEFDRIFVLAGKFQSYSLTISNLSRTSFSLNDSEVQDVQFYVSLVHNCQCFTNIFICGASPSPHFSEHLLNCFVWGFCLFV